MKVLSADTFLLRPRILHLRELAVLDIKDKSKYLRTDSNVSSPATEKLIQQQVVTLAAQIQDPNLYKCQYLPPQ